MRDGGINMGPNPCVVEFAIASEGGDVNEAPHPAAAWVAQDWVTKEEDNPLYRRADCYS